MSKTKRRCSGSDPQPHHAVCIVHAPCLRDHGPFTPLSSSRTSPAEKIMFLNEIKVSRLAEPLDSAYRLEDSCRSLPSSLEDVATGTIAGYHRKCYANFTMNLARLKQPPKHAFSPSSSIPGKHHSPRKRKCEADVLFPPTCIFCDKLEIWVKTKKAMERPKLFTHWIHKESGWQSIAPRAEEMGDNRLYRLTNNVDLHAKSAMYHPSCYHDFCGRYSNFIRKKTTDNDSDQVLNVAAHKKAYMAVKTYVEVQLVGKNEVVLLSLLRDVYIKELEKEGFPNVNFRAEKLLKKLKEDPQISPRLAFSKVSSDHRGCLMFWLVYRADITTADAMAWAYKLASIATIEDVGQQLRTAIQRAFKDSEEMPWPPTVHDLQEPQVPENLQRFLNFVLAGQGKANEKCQKTKRLVLSIGQDICRAATAGQWKLPKHILLCTTIRHLYRSRQLTTILHHLGHCENYDFGIELETALVKAIDEMSTFRTPQIVTGEDSVLVHFEWDNLNKTTTSIHGNNMIDHAAGIIMQETKHERSSDGQRALPILERSKSRSLKVEKTEMLPPLHIYSRNGPKFPVEASFDFPPENEDHYNTALRNYYIWLFSRRISSKSGQQVCPALGGFTSATGEPPGKKTTIDYFVPISQSITQYSVVQELLRQSEVVTTEVGQEYVLNTFDLGVVMKAMPLVWRNPDKYSKHIITPGPFHTCMNFLGMLGKKCRGSGYQEILLEAGLVTSGSINSVLSGKAYNKALFCLKTVVEALQRLLIDVFIEERDYKLEEPASLVRLLVSPNRDLLESALCDSATTELIQAYLEFEDNVRQGHLGKTAVYWMSVIDQAHLLFMLQHAVKTNDLLLFHHCNGEMANLFFAYDGQNYSRYLTWYSVFLHNIELTHPGAKDLLAKGGIAVARSLIPGALSAVDKTMEETFMKFVKSTSGGASGIFNMMGAYQRWCRTSSVRAQYFEKMLEICGLLDDPDCPTFGRHRELERASIRKSEEAVQKVLTAIKAFTNPFAIPDKERLYSLASGALVPIEVEVDVLRAEAAGKQAKENFIKRLKNSTSADTFFEPIKRQKLLTMEAANKTVMLTTSQGRLVQYQEQSDLAFQLLIKSQLLATPLDLDVLMSYSLTPVPASLGTPDGYFNKTNKAAAMHYLLAERTSKVAYPSDALFIQDGNALFHSIVALPPTFGEICLQILDQMVVKKNFIFSTDRYLPDSIKATERLRRGSSERLLLGGAATRRPADWKLFLRNDQNKAQLNELLLKVWSSEAAASRLAKSENATLVVDGRVYDLVSSDGKVEVREIPELYSNQEETDSRVILYLHYAVSKGYTSAVVRTPDTDLFFLLLYHAMSIRLTIILDIGVGKHRQLVDVSELSESLGQEYCSTLLGYYVFSGEDCTSAFKGKGKVQPLKKLEKNPKFHQAFRQLGEGWTLAPKTVEQLEAFTCLLYGYPRETSVNLVRAKMMKKMVGENETISRKSNIDLSRIPPCQYSLIPHLERVNHRVAGYRRAAETISEAPKPQSNGQGWEIVYGGPRDVGVLEPVWSKGPILPPSLVDILEARTEEVVGDGEDDDEDIVDIDFSSLISDDEDE